MADYNNEYTEESNEEDNFNPQRLELLHDIFVKALNGVMSYASTHDLLQKSTASEVMAASMSALKLLYLNMCAYDRRLSHQEQLAEAERYIKLAVESTSLAYVPFTKHPELN